MVTRANLASSKQNPAPSEVPPPIPNEQEIARGLIARLRSHPGITVGSLAIHQCPAGLCIEGHVQLIDPNVNLAALLAEVDTTTPILNRVMVTMPTVATSSVGE